MKLNEPFRDALKDTMRSHMELIDFVHKHIQSFSESDQDEQAGNYAKAIAILCADNMNQLQQLHQYFYAMPEGHQLEMFKQCVFRATSANFLAAIESNDKLKAIAPYSQHIVDHISRAEKFYFDSPEDFSKFDSALGELRRRIKVSDSENDE